MLLEVCCRSQVENQPQLQTYALMFSSHRKMRTAFNTERIHLLLLLGRHVWTERRRGK